MVGQRHEVQTGPLTLGLADLDLADNLGTLTVTIGPAG